MSLMNDNSDLSEESPLLAGYRGKRQQLKSVKRYQLKIQGIIQQQYEHANGFAWRARGVAARQYDHGNDFAWRVRGFVRRQYKHANGVAWKVRGFTNRTYGQANQFCWEIRSFFEQKLDYSLLSPWKFWGGLIVITVCVVGIVMLTVDSREPWTTADYPKLRYPSSSIRLLHIHPGSGKRRVECTMETFLFANKPHYDALSYTWGDMRWKTSVTVNGKMMDITENLYNALLSIRLPEETRTVWVDQICIDQTNIEEKSSQVPLMTFIYSRASNVLIWLGYHTPPRWVAKSEDLDWVGGWAVERASLYPRAVMYWIYLLSEEEFWKRCWIIQEVGMASSIRIFFGLQSISWVEFIKLIHWYRTNHRKANVNNILKLDALRQSMYLDRNMFSLAHLLTEFHDCFCSTKLDKVFAFVGMANECRNGCIEVNYNKSPYSVYEELITFQNISSEEPLERRIDLPYFAGVARQNLGRASSSIKKSLEYFGKLADPNSYIYDACGDERAITCYNDASGNITSNAQVLDWWSGIIHWLFPSIFRPHPQYEAIWLPAKQEPPAIWLPDYGSHSSSSKIQVRGFITGTIGDIGPLYSDFIANPDITKRWANAIYFYPNGPDRRKARGLNDMFMSLLSTSPNSVIKNIVPLKKGASAIRSSPRLFLGSQVMIGLLPSNAIVGDLICQFWNSNAVAVVRLGADGIPQIIGRAVIVQDLDNFEWDVLRNKTIFRLPSASIVDLTLDLTILTQLTLDSISFDS